MPDLSLNFADLEPRQRYKLLCGLVVPRPIALVTTLSPDGVVNAAPFSFFNVFSENPALIVLGLQHNAGRHAQGHHAQHPCRRRVRRQPGRRGDRRGHEPHRHRFPARRERAGDRRPGARGLDAGEAATARRRSRRLRMPAHRRPGLRPAARAADRRGAGRARARGHRRPRDASTSTSRRCAPSAACAATPTRASATCSSSSASPTPNGAPSAASPERSACRDGASYAARLPLPPRTGSARSRKPSALRTRYFD